MCLSPYTEPRLLDSFHTFCTPYLQKLDVHDNYLTCPLCRTKICIQDKRVSGLKYYLFNFERSQSDNELTAICELCFDENIAVASCLDFKINVCTNCNDYHKKIKSSHNHSFEKLKLDQLDKHDDDSGNECKEHRKELTFLLKPCNILLCIDPSCPLCKQGPEDRTHFLVVCQHRYRTAVRKPFMDALNIVTEEMLPNINRQLISEPNKLTQIILEYSSSTFVLPRNYSRLEYTARGLCYAPNIARSTALEIHYK
ncbi:unnamed protein product [Mytilus coruscus]|uniref:B box-type domain-containing protein n=1 Tax=Mytilus coruscus TaxID=42192 RepID=A0A6J8A7A6_MYTCO|nr:unnamed protein product [Mytilus coruscus]